MVPSLIWELQIATEYKNQLLKFNFFKRVPVGVPVMAQWLTNPTRNHEVEGSTPGLAQWVKDPPLP